MFLVGHTAGIEGEHDNEQGKRQILNTRREQDKEGNLGNTANANHTGKTGKEQTRKHN